MSFAGQKKIVMMEGRYSRNFKNSAILIGQGCSQIQTRNFLIHLRRQF